MKQIKRISMGFLVTVLFCTNVVAYASTNDYERTSISDFKILNENQLQITFSRAVDKEAAEDISNYNIHPSIGAVFYYVDIKSAKLDETNTVVTLNTGDISHDMFMLGINNNIKDINGVNIDNCWRIFCYHPQAENMQVKIIDNNKVEINFNRVVDKKSVENISNYNISDVYYTYGCETYGVVDIQSAELDITGTKAILNVNNLRAESVYAVLIENVMDIDGNGINTSILFQK
ncbi:hypothetical protein AN1V17_14960 [Vallitalea sediminicola]